MLFLRGQAEFWKLALIAEAGYMKVDVEDGKFAFEHAPRGEKVSVGVDTSGGISATPDLVAGDTV